MELLLKTYCAIQIHNSTSIVFLCDCTYRSRSSIPSFIDGQSRRAKCGLIIVLLEPLKLVRCGSNVKMFSTDVSWRFFFTFAANSVRFLTQQAGFLFFCYFVKKMVKNAVWRTSLCLKWSDHNTDIKHHQNWEKKSKNYIKITRELHIQSTLKHEVH